MPFQEVIQNHITTAQAKQTETLIQQLQALLQPHLRLLDEEKKQQIRSYKRAEHTFCIQGCGLSR